MAATTDEATYEHLATRGDLYKALLLQTFALAAIVVGALGAIAALT